MIIEVTFIRHAKTEGNLKRQYIGSTDQPLCPIGIAELEQHNALGVYHTEKIITVFTSPLKRCIETAKIIFPQKELCIIEDLQECSFGDFEGKSYEDLKDNADYQRFLDSNGETPFPKGEEHEHFKQRCIHAFEGILQGQKSDCSIAILCHGGTIMSILEKYAGKSFYDWQVENCGGYIAAFEDGICLKTTKIANL